MEYRSLGASDLQVSSLALGAMTFGARGPKAIARVDQAGADRLVAHALEVGVNLFDTADIYNSGDSEILLGKALGRHRQHAILATKVGLRAGRDPALTGLSAGHIARSADASLKRLGTDWIDILLAHRIDPTVPLEETLAAFDALIRAGKVRQIGFSNWPAWLAAKALMIQRTNGWQPFIAGQVYYSLADRDVEHDLVPCGLSEGFGLMAFSPLAMGRLTGKYQGTEPATGRLSGYKTFTAPEASRLERILATLHHIATPRAATHAQVALAWLAERRGVSTILVGASQLDQLRSNLAAAGLRLSGEERQLLEEASAAPLPYPASALSAALSADQYAAYRNGGLARS